MLPAVLFPLVFAVPHLASRQSETCNQQYATTTWWPYTLLANLWGESGATGWQCSTLDSVDGNVAKWSTSYSWHGKTSIVSYSNIQLDEGINQQLSGISSMPSSWDWYQSTEGVVADVAYDFFTSYTSGGSNAVEVMVWLANINAGPISHSYNSEGQAVPIASNLYINSHHWNLYSGSNNANSVYSFLPTGGSINSWSGDMYNFFRYLIEHGYIKSSEYLKTAQAGTEVTSGTATFYTSAYSLSIK